MFVCAFFVFPKILSSTDFCFRKDVYEKTPNTQVSTKLKTSLLSTIFEIAAVLCLGSP